MATVKNQPKKDYGYVVDKNAKTDAQRAKEEVAKMKELGLDTSKGVYSGATLDRDIKQAKEIASSPHVAWNPNTNTWDATASPSQVDPNAYKAFLQLKMAQQGTNGITNGLAGNIAQPGTSSMGNHSQQMNEFMPNVDYQSIYNEQAELAKKAAEQRIASELEQLRKGYEATTGRFAQEANALPQQTYQTTQGIKQATSQNARSLNEALAARGLQASGSQAQGEIARGVTEQTGIGNALQREAELKSDIERRRTDLENAYQSDVASTKSGIASNLSSQLASLNQKYTDMGIENQKEQLALDRQQKEKDLSLFASTVDRYSQDYTAEINRLKAQGIPDSDPRVAILEQARSGKVANIELSKQQQLAQQAANQSKQQQLAYDNALDLLKITKRVTSPEQAAILGIPVGTYTTDAQIDLMKANKKRSSSGSSGGSGSGGSNIAYVPKAEKDSAVTALNVLKQLESKGDLVGIQTFIANNATLIDQYASGRTGTLADQQAADEIQRKYYGQYR